MTLDFVNLDAPTSPPATDAAPAVPEERVVRFREFDAAIAATNQRYEAGQIDEAALAELVETTYDPGNGYDGAGPDTSFGMEWLRHHFKLDGERNGAPNTAFIAFMTSVVPDVATFMVEHVKNWTWTASALMSQDILGLMDRDTLIAFVELVFQQVGSWNNSYVEVWTKLGVPRESIARCILSHLRRAKADHEREYSNSLTTVHEFLRYGSGVADHRVRFEQRPAENSVWAMLDDREFEEASEMCLAKSPGSILEHRMQLTLRLSEERITSLCTQAINVLADVPQPRMRTEFFGMSLLLRLHVCDRLTTDGVYNGFSNIAKLVLTTAADLEAEDAGLGAIWLDQVPVMSMENMSAVSIYRAAIRLREARQWTAFPAWLERRLEAYLNRGGYVIGRVQRVENSRTRLKEDVVDIGRDRYIGDTRSNGSPSFYPNEGEEVIFNTKRASPILARADQRPVCINGKWLHRTLFHSLRPDANDRS